MEEIIKGKHQLRLIAKPNKSINCTGMYREKQGCVHIVITCRSVQALLPNRLLNQLLIDPLPSPRLGRRVAVVPPVSGSEEISGGVKWRVNPCCIEDTDERPLRGVRGALAELRRRDDSGLSGMTTGLSQVLPSLLEGMFSAGCSD